MMWGAKLEGWLPSRQTVSVVLQFRIDSVPREAVLNQLMRELGYHIAWDSLLIINHGEKPEWRFFAIALGKNHGTTLAEMAQQFSSFEWVEGYQLSLEHN